MAVEGKAKPLIPNTKLVAPRNHVRFIHREFVAENTRRKLISEAILEEVNRSTPLDSITPFQTYNKLKRLQKALEYEYGVALGEDDPLKGVHEAVSSITTTTGVNGAANAVEAGSDAVMRQVEENLVSRVGEGVAREAEGKLLGEAGKEIVKEAGERALVREGAEELTEKAAGKALTKFVSREVASKALGIGAGVLIDGAIRASDGELSGKDVAGLTGSVIGGELGTIGATALASAIAGTTVGGPVGFAVGFLGGVTGAIAGDIAFQKVYEKMSESAARYDAVHQADKGHEVYNYYMTRKPAM